MLFYVAKKNKSVILLSTEQHKVELEVKTLKKKSCDETKYYN